MANYFTGESIGQYFRGYCQHFGIASTSELDAERKYARHFDREWRQRRCLGYEIILELHATSSVPCFVAGRRKFDGFLIRKTSPYLGEIERILDSHVSVMNITYRVENAHHSVTVLRDGEGLVVRDTGRQGFRRIDGLEDLGRLADSVLYLPNRRVISIPARQGEVDHDL